VYSLSCLFFVIHRQFPFFNSPAIVLSGSIILISGVWDDFRELSVTAKILLQVCAVSVLVSSGFRTHIVLLNTPANIAVTFLWILTITNAFNLLDIMDGLCAIITLAVAAGLFFICILNGDIQNAGLLAIVLGAVAGFLVFNMPSAKLYLGNAGSHYLGFALAVLSINISYAPITRQAALISPVIIMGFPLFDTVFVALMRLKKGRSAFQKSGDHLALRFLKLGHSQKNALLFMLIGAVIFSGSGVIISQVSHTAGIMIAAAVLAAVFAVSWRMARVSFDE
ncbi:MAG: MraY family glycosyltransferase, partial [Candidatus Omnitrophota bacterium]